MSNDNNALVGKTVLITGGGGMIGSQICRQAAAMKPVRIVCLGQNEENLKPVLEDLRKLSPSVEVAIEVCDVRERDRLATVFGVHRPSIVFHTAARKDIRDAEANPAQAVMVNVQGTVNVVELALASDSEKLVFTSSIKAFRPVGVMGATKRLGEMVVASAAGRTGKLFFTVRLGNVLESGGGVHDLFRRQIASGGPVTVTHPDAERRFVTAAEAARLLLETLSLGQPGDILALAAGEKTNIGRLASRLIRLYGSQLGHDVDIEYTGLRPGEKLVEEATLDGKEWLPTVHDKILVFSLAETVAPGTILDHSLSGLFAMLNKGDKGALLEQLSELVTDYRPMSN